ncbi:alanine racemase [Desulfurobacterium atlanticum]|uniref:Diaminopimelate decarboxylase n=1 Tax=Desulfurobacterium atlanticum TaxID=240169 RepID=A0A238Y2G7_9BACT|nr:alanine racemase [Desulfurobacterium atlanticum]SNR65162.1 diaminopimelate decarboxylase [Desulfurobacterium atlanticum]
MRKPYEKPTIFKLHTGMMNKFGSFAYPLSRRVRTEIDSIPIKELVEKYGTPLFVFSEKTLRRKFREIKQAFTTRYPNVEFTWSYKTNYLDAICAILHDEGETAEVVSEFEYEKARRLGVPGNQIIFNGPYKPKSILKTAIKEGAKINIDTFEEITDIEEVAAELGIKPQVGIRLNMDTGIHPQWSRFGFNLESGQAFDAVKRITYGGQLELCGLHCHIGTFILEPKAYETEVKKMVEFAYRIEDEFGLKIEYIDVGGGFPSKNRLKGVYLPPEVAVPSIEEIADRICSALLSSLRPGDFPKLIIESGRAIVDEAGYLITQVHATKRLPDGRKGYILDAGVNILFTAFWYHFNIEIDRNVTGPSEPCILYGPLCMNIDVVDDLAYLPPLPRGTNLILSPVGAYNVTQWMQFIRYRPNVVLIGENGEVDLIREAETLEDIVNREHLPERLKLKED